MMLGDQGPQTSIEEDLQALGMGHLLAEADTCPSSKGDGDDDDEDEDEGKEEQTEAREYDEETGRTEIEVRAEDEDEYEIDEDEFFEIVGEFMESLDLDEDQVDDALESEEFTDIFVEALVENDALDEIDEDEEDEEIEEDEDEIDDPRMEAAADLLGLFYEHLQTMTEDDDRPNYDDLVGVIEAFEYLTDGILDETKRTMGLRALRKARRMKSRLAKRGKMKRSTFKAAKRGRMMIGGHEFKAGAASRAQFRKLMRSASPRRRKALKKRLKAQMGVTSKDVKARITGKKMAADVEPQGSPISELVQHLNDLREAVQSDDSAAEELVDGLRSVFETATTFYERIAEEVSSDESIEEEDKEDDPRVAMGRHLESIAEDSAAVAQRIVEGEADINDAADDLRALAADLDDAMEAMKGIE